MSRPRSLATALAALALAAVGAAPASASLGPSDCGNPSGSAVFAPWYDGSSYFLAPDGGFENNGAGWSGGSVVSGNESYAVSGPGSKALAVGSGATSPSVCVGLENPTFRFFVRRTSGSPLASLAVSVVLADGTSVPVGAVGGGSSWQPSPVLLIGANLLPLIAGGDSTNVSFRFTPNAGTWQIDDVYVDPRGSN